MLKIAPLIAAAFAVLPANAETWVKVISPHFTVLSNGSAKDAREVAAGFEQIHAVFALALPGLRTDSGAETIVIAAKDEKSFVELMPSEKKRANYLAGEFHKGWEKDYVVIRLDLPGQTRNIVYHEYIHKLLRLNFTRLPVWLDEGLAEFFANTESRSNEMYLGAPSPRIQILRSRSLYPLPTILSATASSPYYRDEDKISMFYAESWGLTHFLMFGENMGRGRRMNAYLESLQKGVASDTAFARAFGDPKAVEKQFENYLGQFAFLAMRVDKPNVDLSAFKSGSLSAAEADARLGSLFTYFHQFELAEQRLTAALHENPEAGLAHENMAFLRFQQGNDDEAAKEFDEAAKLDPTSYLSLYYQAMLKFHSKTDAESLSTLDTVLQKVLQLNPRFAPALVVRSQIYVRQGRLQQALDLATQAQKLEPDRAGYLTNVAAILLLGHNYSESTKFASIVAGRWAATDSAEALTILARARQSGGIQPTPGNWHRKPRR